MTKNISKKNLNNFKESYKYYLNSYVKFNKLSSDEKFKITNKLIHIESNSSVDIEHQRCFKCVGA